MREFDYLSYCTEYSATCVDHNYHKAMKQDACFATIYKMFNNYGDDLYTVKYKVILYRGYEYTRRSRLSNACLLSHNDLRNHIDQLKGIIPFKCRITKNNNDGKPVFKVDVTITDGTILQHKYFLAWLRYAYEYPFNVMLLDARKLRWEKEFRFESGFNLFNVVAQCLDLWSPGHSIAYGNTVKLLKKEALKKKLLHLNEDMRLNDIFACSHTGAKMIPRMSEMNTRLGVRDIEYWINDQLFAEERLPVYKARLKYLHKKK